MSHEQTDSAGGVSLVDSRMEENETNYRYGPHGVPAYDYEFVTFSCVDRPTTASSIRSKLWSRERKVYEDERKRNMVEFENRPYLRHQYPDIPKHYPGTWRVATTSVVQDIVARLTKPTSASRSRARDTTMQRAYVSKMKHDERMKDIKLRFENPSKYRCPPRSILLTQRSAVPHLGHVNSTTT